MPAKRYRRKPKIWANFVAEALIEDQDEVVDSAHAIGTPVIFWSKSDVQEKGYTLWLWDHDIAREDYKTTMKEALSIHGQTMSTWPQYTQATVNQMALFDPKKKNCKLDPKSSSTEQLSYIKNCGYECKDILLLPVKTDSGTNWSLVFINESQQYFGLDLKGKYGVTDKSYITGIAEMFAHSPAKFAPKPEKFPNYFDHFQQFFSKKWLVGDTSLLLQALHYDINAQVKVEDNVFTKIRGFLMAPHKATAQTMPNIARQLQAFLRPQGINLIFELFHINMK